MSNTVNRILEESISYLERVDGRDHGGALDYMSGGSFTEAIRYMTYSLPKLRKIGDYYILDWIQSGERDEETLEILRDAEKNGELSIVQPNYCYVEPEMQLYGKEGAEELDYPTLQRTLLGLMKVIWEGYLHGFSENCRFVVEIDEDSGRVQFYQKFN